MSSSRNAATRPAGGVYESIRRAYEAGELERAYRLVLRSLGDAPEDGRL